MSTREDYEVGMRVIAKENFPNSNVERGEVGVVEASHTNGITIKWDKPGRFKSAFDWNSAMRLLRVMK